MHVHKQPSMCCATLLLYKTQNTGAGEGREEIGDGREDWSSTDFLCKKYSRVKAPPL
jgi:hypothetical protein